MPVSAAAEETIAEAAPPADSEPAESGLADNGSAQADSPAAAAQTSAGGGGGEAGASYVEPDFNASYLSNPKAEYPYLSRRLREQGMVRLRVYVTAQGRSDKVILYESSGYTRLDKAAIDVVWRWRFKPASRAGAAVAGWVIIPIKFQLHD